MNRIKHRAEPRRAILASAVLLAFIAPATVQAFEFSSASGELTGSFDTTLSVGGLWRMQDRESSLISIANGGTSRDPNSDDGNLKYDKGDMVSLAFKATHDLELNYRNYGAFFRASYFYDHAFMNKSGMSNAARSELGRDAEILDAYVRGRFELGGRTLNLRAGRQVVSWGESTFIQNGINILNPVNVSRLRIPGSELREGLTPIGMLWASQELTDNVSAELVWMAEWEKTKIEPAGTFFSTNDFVSAGGSNAYTGFGRRNDGNVALGAPPSGLFPADPAGALVAPRSRDREPGNGEEYGLALRAFLPQLNHTEIGFYHVNYHSRTPFVSGYRGGITAPGSIAGPLPVGGAPVLGAAGIPVAPAIPGCNVLDIPTFGFLHTQANILGLANVLSPGNPLAAIGAATQLSALNATNAACGTSLASGGRGTYFVDYPKNIKLFGLSFNTEGPAGIALQGEYSYRHNQPLQLPSAELLGAALGIPNQITGTTPADLNAVSYGDEIAGYRRVKMHQVQMTGTKAVSQVLGAEQMVLVGELGYTHLQLPSGVKFAAAGCHLPQPGSSLSASFGSTDSNCFMSENSWGYRLLARFDYPNLFAGVNVSPRIAFSHDVSGRSPTFNEGAKAVTLGLGMNYRQNWQADIAYSTFFGGKKIGGTDPVANTAGQAQTYASHTNPLYDRDFLSISVSYSF
ncbi:DUF1302 domain-containing protein [Thauera sp.]|uniref:DUF1302 domain-containing protein n=1 Tax=Thauera sp. TaxID=1905334 RepID=UPI002C2C286D|nr:DUF1302 domain-containing protein [Thauera sp.]HRP22504.1 DUF1302 domain-containing protein [Thauera sp.]